MTFIPQKHEEFIRKNQQVNENELDSIQTSHLRINGMYWGLTTLALMNKITDNDRETISEFVMKCYDKKHGGYGGNIGYDAHIYTTLSAIQILCLLNKRDLIPVEEVSQFIKSCQLEDGSFVADKWGECDNRFVFCAVLALKLINKLEVINSLSKLDK